jgi:hypothetical protein
VATDDYTRLASKDPLPIGKIIARVSRGPLPGTS